MLGSPHNMSAVSQSMESMGDFSRRELLGHHHKFIPASTFHAVSAAMLRILRATWVDALLMALGRISAFSFSTPMILMIYARDARYELIAPFRAYFRAAQLLDEMPTAPAA